MHFQLLRISIVVIAAALASHAYVGQWQSFTNKERITSLIAHKGRVYAGSIGGIRRINPVTLAQEEFDNLDGLLDCWVTGLAESGDGALWAVSRSGYLSRLAGKRWEVFGRSFAAGRWTMNDRAVLASGRYLFLGSEKGLALFDVAKQVSQANFTRFADQVDLSVLSLLRRADTLYIGTSLGVYKAGVDFADPLNPAPRYGSLLDPKRWSKVALPAPIDTGAAAKRRYDFMAFIEDSLATFGPGMILDGPVKVKAMLGDSLRIGKKTFGLDWLNCAVFSEGKLFLGGYWQLIFSPQPLIDSPWVQYLEPKKKFPYDTLANIVAYNGTVWGQAVWGMHRYQGVENGFQPVQTGVIPSYELTIRFLKNLATDSKGDVYVGSWGAGVQRIRGNETRSWTHTTDSCIFEILPNYPVVHAVSNRFKDHIFFSMFKSELGEDHQLGYLNTETEKITCLDSTVAGGHPHIIRMFSDSLLGVGSERGVAFFRMREGANAPLLTSIGQWTSGGQANESWDLASDRWGRPWAVIGNGLAFADSLVDSKGNPLPVEERKFKAASGFLGQECRVLEQDPLNKFWVGCANGLFLVEPAPEGIGKVTRYGLDDGLLHLSIRDISIDPSNGHVWIATDRGVNRLESQSQPPVAKLKSVKAYPNPFRPQHRFVIFDHLPLNSTVRLHTSTGDVVRILRPTDLAGNQAQWDGKNQEGKPVAAGVYLYSVVAGTSVERGKVIVAR